MSQHLEDRVLTDLAFDLLEPKEAAAAKRHLQGCKACKARQKKLRATIAQLDATRADFKASEDLIARTLRTARGEKLIQAQPAPKPKIAASPTADKSAEIDQADNILDLPPRRSVLELQRFFWLAAAASLVVAGFVWFSTFGLKDKNTVASASMDKVAAPVAEPAASPVLEKELAFKAPKEPDTSRLAAKDASVTAPRAIQPARELKEERVAHDEPIQVTLADRDGDALAAKPEKLANAMKRSAPAPKPTAAPMSPPIRAEAPAPVAVSGALAKSDTRSRQHVAPASASALSAPAPASGPVALGGSAAATTYAAPAAPAPMVAAAPAASRRGSFTDDIEFTVQTIQFMLPVTSGTWVLQQNVRILATVTDTEARLTISNHGVLPVNFQLLPRRGTNILQQFELDSGATTNLIHRTR